MERIMPRISTLLPRNDLWKFSEHLAVNEALPDRPLWPLGKGSSYSVKSGYLLACSLRDKGDASSSNSDQQFWNWIWSLEVIPKVKIFLWKCLSGALPTATALLSRSVAVDPCCRRCGEKLETTEHALRDCPWVSFLWEISPLRLPPLGSTEICTVKDWFFRIMEVPDKEVHNSFATLAWASWYARNIFVFQDKRISQADCLLISQRALWRRPLCPFFSCSKPSSVFCSRADQVKIQCDAAVGEGIGIGFGAIMFDAEDKILGSRFGFVPGCFSAEEGEARAVLESIILCEEKEYSDVIVETDCQQLFWRIVKREKDLSFIGDSLLDIFGRLNRLRPSEISWVPRNDNYVADSLAKHALLLRLPVSSCDTLPVGFNTLL